MIRMPVQSSNLKSVGYDVSLSRLEVEFLNETVYQYYPVPSTVWAEFRRRVQSGESIGTYFNSNVKPHYAFHKVR